MREISKERIGSSAGMVAPFRRFLKRETGQTFCFVLFSVCLARALLAPVAAIESPVLDGLGDVRDGDRRLGVKVGHRPGNFENAVVGAGG
jgi:hypothetical protein